MDIITAPDLPSSGQNVPSTSPPVWVIDQFALTPEIPGGIRHWEIGRRLVDDGVPTEVWAGDLHLSSLEFLHLRFPKLRLTEDRDGLTWHWLWVSRYRRNNWRRMANLVSFSAVFLMYALFRRRPALIYGSSPHLIPTFAAYCLARLRRIPFYLEVRDLWPQVLIDMGGKNESSRMVRLLGWMERKMYRGARRVVVLAPGAVDYVVERGANREDVVLAPNGVRLPDLAALPDVASAREAFGLPADRFIVAYTGAHGTANSLHTLVDAAIELERTAPGCYLILLVGSGMEKTSLLERAAGHASIELRDPIPKLELPALLQACDALALTLLDIPVFRYGVSPRKLFDYYAAAKPVVVNVAGDVTEEVQTHNCGETAPPEDPFALAEAVRRIAALPPEGRAAMGRRGRMLAEAQYDLTVVAARVSEAIRDDLGLTSPK